MTTVVRVRENQYKPLKGPRTFRSRNRVLNPAKGEKFRNLNAIGKKVTRRSLRED